MGQGREAQGPLEGLALAQEPQFPLNTQASHLGPFSFLPPPLPPSPVAAHSHFGPTLLVSSSLPRTPPLLSTLGRMQDPSELPPGLREHTCAPQVLGDFPGQ